ncbi:Endoplasmic reticulum ca-transporting p-type atpase [Rhizoctonia solani]|uniref:Endoplasmic reticulum ca-transporting p-type atpase n=1 Tax=Rhizoctonia solani TaxID=456999 RepID=A0A8H7HFG3_9AGAM|nr:Endoplasmic reticulum ca-transporting p-type atpase [Rhizoctonia solani]
MPYVAGEKSRRRPPPRRQTRDNRCYTTHKGDINRPDIVVTSPDIVRASLHRSVPFIWHAYALPFSCMWPVLAYAYYVRYDDWIKSEEWSFIFTVGLGASHALSFLSTRWSTGVRAWVTTHSASSLESADCIRIVPAEHRGQGEIVPLIRKPSPQHPSRMEFAFVYQRDTYVYDSDKKAFAPLPYPCNDRPLLSSFEGNPTGLMSAVSTKGGNTDAGTVEALSALYGKNEFDIPIPSFLALFGEHTTAPFFVFQIFCVALWCLDEYWYYSLFTLFMLVVFECTVVFQRVSTLKEFRTMSIDPYPIYCYRDGKWNIVQSDTLLPGDVISISRGSAGSEHKKHEGKAKEKKVEDKDEKDKEKDQSTPDRSIPADTLILRGTCIVNEAMLSGESTPLLKESLGILSKEEGERLDVDGQHKNCVLFGGTKILKAGQEEGEVVASSQTPSLNTPDGGALALVLRTGFGTAQGQLVRTMIFSTERVSANNFESFLFIGFLLIFAIAASWYVWVRGIERGLKKSKLLLDCVLIITSVVPPELPMELSLAVNTSLAALSKFAIFCTEPFRIPVAGRVDVCCFDKTGTITAVDLVVEGVAGVDPTDPLKLVPLTAASRETTLCLAAAHALVKLDDGQVVGDPMEQTTLKALEWDLKGRDGVVPNKGSSPTNTILIRRRFQFSSALKRMATISTIGAGGKSLIAVKGAPETIKGMLAIVPGGYDDTFKWFTRRGSRVLALAMKEVAPIGLDKVAQLKRDEIEKELTFVGFLIFHCPLKPDAIATLKMLADSSHRCIMITGDNPLTAVHVAREVEIVDRDALILDVKEGSNNETDLVWRTVDETKIIPVNPSEPLDASLFEQYDVCITGAAMRQYERTPSWPILVQNTWVYARVSPIQKELILTTLKGLGFTTLMAGDGTNDVGALKQAHIGVALLDGTPEDLQKIAEHARVERIKKVYESQLKISARFNQPPPPVPQAIAHLYQDVVAAQQKAAADLQDKRKKNPMEKFDLESITSKLAEMDDDNEPPKIKLGDASCAAPFTSKLSNVSSIAAIIRQGRCTLVATIQMYKILALNCLITAYSLSVLYLDGIKFGDYQITINGMLMSVCFLCISRAKPVEKLSRERPLGNIFNFYVLLSVLIQFAIHIVSLLYITSLSNSLEQRGEIDLEAEFKPSLLNTAIYLLGLSQQVSTFAINFQGRPFREGIRENPALYYGLLGASAVAFGGSMDIIPEMNRWLQIVEMSFSFQVRLTVTMALDFVGCWAVEHACKYLFADLEPKYLVTRGRERREARRAIDEAAAEAEKAKQELEELEKKAQ